MVTSTDGTWSGKGSFIGAGSTALVENTHRLTKGLGGRTGKGREEYEGKGDSVVQVGEKGTQDTRGCKGRRLGEEVYSDYGTVRVTGRARRHRRSPRKQTMKGLPV